MSNSPHIPEIRFDFSFLLSEQASEHLNKLWGDGTPLLSFEEYTKIAAQYEKWWKADGEKIVRALCELTGLQFYQNTIDVHVAPWFYAFSSPMVLGVTFRAQDELVNTLTHEIIHRLLTDNTTYARDFDFLKLWKSMFGEDHEWNTLVHIPVHALMQELYIDVLHRPDLLELDRKSIHEYGNKDYITAWEYVDSEGYKTITGKIRKHAKKARVIG